MRNTLSPTSVLVWPFQDGVHSICKYLHKKPCVLPGGPLETDLFGRQILASLAREDPLATD